MNRGIPDLSPRSLPGHSRFQPAFATPWMNSIRDCPIVKQHVQLQLRKIRTCKYCLSNEIGGFFCRAEYSNRSSVCLGARLPGLRVAECALDGPLSDALLSSLWLRQSSESQPLMRLN